MAFSPQTGGHAEPRKVRRKRVRLHRLQAEFFEILGLRPLQIQAEIGGLNLLSATHQDGTLQRVFELSNVAGPGILRHDLQCGSIESADFATITGRIAAKKVDGERRNILTALAQRRHMNLHSVESKQEILTKLA